VCVRYRPTVKKRRSAWYQESHTRTCSPAMIKTAVPNDFEKVEEREREREKRGVKVVVVDRARLLCGVLHLLGVVVRAVRAWRHHAAHAGNGVARRCVGLHGRWLV
jgi:hypothetical protein